MMLDELGQSKAAEQVVKAIESVLLEGKIKTKDLGGNHTCSDMGNAVSNKLGG
jgi:isocitrate/isopropylmalate dehydrogenase